MNGKIKGLYALTNKKEYFSGLTEAYFGKNDFYSFAEEEPKSDYPTVYTLVDSIWQVK
ncbi:MAG: hypothetical protein ABGY95_11460 [Rubritalea sp.]|uniref:hypothetical protein n=1 Tax=Rubritalea sp. TaxID=2109375 RepID=UPI0032424FCD